MPVLSSAELYAENSKVQFQDGFAHFFSRVSGHPTRVLDIGSGDGGLSARISEMLGPTEFIGLDSDPEMVRYAQKTYGNEKLSFLEGDATSFYFDFTFEVICSFSTLHWISNQTGVLTRVWQALSNGGQFIAMLYPRCDIQWTAIENAMALPAWSRYFENYVEHFHAYDARFFASALDKIGFSNIEARITETELRRFNDIDQLIGFMRPWLPHLRYVPEPLREDFLRESCALYADKLAIVDGKLMVPFRQILVSSVKL